MLKEVKLGAMGKVSFYFKDSNRFYNDSYRVCNSTHDAARGQQKFKSYIKEFAKRVNG